MVPPMRAHGSARRDEKNALKKSQPFVRYRDSHFCAFRANNPARKSFFDFAPKSLRCDIFRMDVRIGMPFSQRRSLFT